MATEDKAAPKTAREKILELQQEMAQAQVEVAKGLVDFIGGDTTAEYIEGLKALHDKTIPGSQLDQSIAQLINVTAQTGQIAAQLYQQMLQQQAQQR